MAKRGPKAHRSKLPQKQAKATPEPSSQNQRPVFCFQYVDRASRNEWVFDPSDEHAGAVLKFLCRMAELTWAQIEGQKSGGHKRHHDQPISSMDPEAAKDIRRCKLDETFGDEMFRFRLTGVRRLWGFRDGRIFHVVWWDPNHKVYETEPN